MIYVAGSRSGASLADVRPKPVTIPPPVLIVRPDGVLFAPSKFKYFVFGSLSIALGACSPPGLLLDVGTTASPADVISTP